MAWVAGVDGCPVGWIAVLLDLDGRAAPRVVLALDFADLLARSGPFDIVAVDMPIGLPEQVGAGGRGPEGALRPHLGARQSSVFSMPARAAVEALDYRAACDAALATSEPPRKISKQAFFLFPKIREIDALLRADAALGARVRESHPEGVFMVMNGGRPLTHPKKVKSRVWPDGMAERRALLIQAGFTAEFLAQAPPRGAATDDFLDACACAVAARRIARGEHRSFPEAPKRDAHGLLMAIHA
jgi:threonine dehydratase